MSTQPKLSSAMVSVASFTTPLISSSFSLNTKSSSLSSAPSLSQRIRPCQTFAFATSTAASSARTCTDRQPRMSSSFSSSSSSSYLRFQGAPSCASLYDVLGIPSAASIQEIKLAYRRLARLCHPDVVAIDRKDTSADDFMRIHAAYSTLSDPVKRADYDQSLFRRYQPSTVTSSRFSGYPRRNWETDQCW